jgi:hypothetical protein
VRRSGQIGLQTHQEISLVSAVESKKRSGKALEGLPRWWSQGNEWTLVAERRRRDSKRD